MIYLDFNGHTVTGTVWNTAYNQISLVCKPFDTDGDATTFSDSEQAAIIQVWERVAEDYAPFDVDVTTEQPATFTSQTARALITSKLNASGLYNPSGQTAGGVAYVDVFGQSNYVGTYSPAFIYFDSLGSNPGSIANALSHEIGHNLGLNHDGTTTPKQEYYDGHGTGETSWGPIMGGGYGRNVSQWSKGEYFNASNPQDDLAVIVTHIPYVADDFSDASAGAGALTLSATPTIKTGRIERTNDADRFYFNSGPGTVTFNASPYKAATGTFGGNLDIVLELYNSSGTLVTRVDPTTTTTASLSAVVAAGSYYLRVVPTGVGTPTASSPSGYTAYGSLGAYSITYTGPSSSNSVGAPTANAATGITVSSFTANWSSVTGATGYRLDVSTSSTFASFVSGFQDLDVGNVTIKSVGGLNPATTYYYRVRAYAAAGTSINSNTISLTTTNLTTPANNAFANSILITGSSASVTGSNVNATQEVGEPQDPALPGGKSVWWTWVAPAAGPVTITTSGSTFDTILGVFIGNAVNALTVIAVNDDVSTSASWSSVSFTSIQGATYRIAVDGYEAASGSIQLNLISTAVAAPVISSSLAGTCQVGVAFTYAITAINTPTSFNATGLPPGLAVNTSNGVISGTPTAAGTFSVTISAANTGGTDSKTLVVTVLPAPPANDAFANSILITGSSASVTGSNVNATQEVGEPQDPTSPGGKSVWWRWVAPAAGTVTITTNGSSFDTLLGVFTGNVVNALTQIAVNDDVTFGVAWSSVSFTSIQGATYRIGVDGYNATSGSIQLNLTSAAIPGPVISSSLAANCQVGVAFTYAITASNTPTSFNATGLPPGLSVNTATGVISGTPTASGTFGVTIAVANTGGGDSKTLVLTVTIPPAPVLSGSFATTGKLRFPYSYAITASNSPTSYNATGLPPGLSVNTSTGMITGSPTATGTYGITIAAANYGGVASSTLTLTITRAPQDSLLSGTQSDLLLENSATGERVIWQMNGAGITASAALPTITAGWHFAGTGDFNSDGRSDIVLQNTTSGERVVWLMNGATISSSVALPTLPLAWQIACVGDLNVDGKPDIILQNTQTNERVAWFMNGTTIASSYNPPALPAAWQFCGIMDFSGDGLPDLLIQNTDTGERVIWVLNAQFGITRSINLPTFYAGWRFAGVGRFTPDNLPNIVLQNTLNGERALWSINTAGAITASTPLPTLPVVWSFAGPALNRAKAPVGSDLNRDGKPDILVTDTTSGERILWTMNGTAIAGSVALPTLPSSWQFMGTGDFNADGMNDILLQNSSTGDRQIWLMNGTSIAGVTALPTLPTTWSLAAVGDINQDGQPDIVLENRSTGARVIWLMDKTAISASVDLPTIPVSWTIAAAGTFSAGGQPTLLLENTSSGERTFWVLNTAGSLQQSLGLPSFLGGWRFAGAAPYFGGTKPHILLQNLSSGERVIWRMDNASIAASSSVVSLPVNYILKN